LISANIQMEIHEERLLNRLLHCAMRMRRHAAICGFSWTDKSSHHTSNLFCRMWLSLRIRIYIEDLRYNQLRIYGKQLRINGTISWGSMESNWGSTAQSVEDLWDHQLRIYGTIEDLWKSIEDQRYNHFQIYGKINW